MEIKTDWYDYLQDEFEKKYYKRLINFIHREFETKKVYPPKHDIFRALNVTSFANTKVIILGQDPYHGPGQANGLSFSVSKDVTLQPSLRNIYKELSADLNCKVPTNGDLTYWAKEGVLLLNTVLTVVDGRPNSHKNIGWEVFTDRIISILSERKENLVFILWGKHALNKGKNIDQNKHLIIHSPHPSPLSAHRGFYNSRPFSKANNYLLRNGIKPINWIN